MCPILIIHSEVIPKSANDYVLLNQHGRPLQQGGIDPNNSYFSPLPTKTFSRRASVCQGAAHMSPQPAQTESE